MQTIELNKRVASIEVADDKIIINLEQKYIPQDGEYFYVETKANSKFVGIKKEGKYITHRYYYYDIEYPTIYGEGWICSDDHIKEIRPATKKEKELLDKALEARGKRWNPETKQIEKLPKVGDFCIFWNHYKKYAICSELIAINKIRGRYYSIWESYSNCIPFQSVEHFKEFIKS
ncbi:MAG: hypothetical protein PHQ11_13970 [Paludibacter sp.]|nr:hypothetical protein [Paludibacter sp.]